MKKIIGLFIFLGLATMAKAQFSSVKLQASGLTCAMCAKSIYKNLEGLTFVDKIDTDLNGSSFIITVKEGAKVDPDLIRKKVEDAGFAVAGLQLTARFNGVSVKNDRHINFNGYTLHFLNVKDQLLNGDQTLTLVDKSFVPAKEFKKYSGSTKMECYWTGTSGDCCKKEGIAETQRIFHVTI